MRRSILALALLLTPTLACPRPSETEPGTAAKPEAKPALEPEPSPKPEPASEPSPTVGEWALAQPESSVGFAVARATIGHVGKFEDFTATLELADGQPSKLAIAVETKSVVADRTGLTHHLLSADFFDVAKFPTATFTATEFTPNPEAGEHAFTVRGTMTLHGVTTTLEFPAKLVIEPERVLGSATLDISAKAFGIDYAGMEAELAEDAVQLEIELVFTRVAGPSRSDANVPSRD